MALQTEKRNREISPRTRTIRLRKKYQPILGQLQVLPDNIRKRTERSFLILKEFEEYIEPEGKIRFKKYYQQRLAIRLFCESKKIGTSSYYRWQKNYRKFGILGLIPKYGKWKDHSRDGAWLLNTQKTHQEKIVPGPIILNIRFDPQCPLSCFRVIRSLTKDRIEIPKNKKDALLTVLDFIIKHAKVYYFQPIQFELLKEDIPRLERYRDGNHKCRSTRATGLLMAHAGKSIFDIIVTTGRSKSSILRWIQHYKKSGLDFIETRQEPEKKEKLWEERKTRVIDILHSPPSTYKINRTSWTYDTIIKAYQKCYKERLPKGALKRIIKSTGYTWRHCSAGADEQ